MEAYNYAVSNKTGTLTLFGQTIIPANTLHGPADEQLVQSITIDEILTEERCPFVNIIKIDIEGAEILAFQGMTKTLVRNPEVIILSELAPEMLQSGGHTVKDYFDLLSSLGFKYFYDITENSIVPLKIPCDIERIKNLEIGNRSLGIVEVLISRNECSDLLHAING